MIEPNACKCGHMPETFTQYPVSKGMYRGFVECPECGETIYSHQWHDDRDDAAYDAVEAWNEAMPEEEQTND